MQGTGEAPENSYQGITRLDKPQARQAFPCSFISRFIARFDSASVTVPRKFRLHGSRIAQAAGSIRSSMAFPL